MTDQDLYDVAANFLDEVQEDANAAAIPTEEKLSRLSSLAQQLIDAEDQVASLENQIKAAKEEVGRLSELAIPELMSDVGVREFKLSNGLKVSVKPFFSGKITDENAGEAYDWLDQRGFSDIVKGELIVQFRRNEDVTEIMELAHQLNFDTKEKMGIHHQTLSAFIKEQITEGKDLPRELFGVYTGFKTKIGR